MHEHQSHHNDFEKWQHELEANSGREYRAPSQLKRFGQKALFWISFGKGKRGPEIEYYDTPETQTEDDGLNPA